MSDSEQSYDEAAIIARVIGGNRDDFRHLVSRHQDMVFAMIMRQVGNRSIAEEIAQETFCKAYQHLKSFRSESSFSTWLTRIALNQVSTYFTSRRYKQSRKTESFEIEAHDMSNPNSGNPHERKEFFQAFRKAIAEISPKLRDVLVLCALEGKSYEEASQILDIPIGTVRSRLNAARLSMRELIPATFFEA